MPWPVGALIADPRQEQRGVGRVVECDARRASLRFADGTEALITLREASFRRHRIAPGSAVLVLEEGMDARRGIVTSAPAADRSDDELWDYTVELVDGRFTQQCETSLQPVFEATEDPVAQLTSNQWRGPQRFFARLDLLGRRSVWHENSDGIPSLLGARVRPLFHQVYAVRRALADRALRFVLADEVGLGKTIEAGLILQAIESLSPGRRVLVVTPGAMSRQWLCELYLRFGGRVFTHLDAVEFGRRKKAARVDALASTKLIVTTTLLRQYSEALDRLAADRFDLVVIDEAHQIHSEDSLYEPLRGISAKANGALILSATPSGRDEAGLLAMLALAAPESYSPRDLPEFRRRLQLQSVVWDKLSYSQSLLAVGGEERAEAARELAQEWDGVISDEFTEGCLRRMREGDAEAASELVAYVQEHHRLDHRIIRTRRETLNRFDVPYANRTLEVIDYSEHASPEERAIASHLERLGRLSRAGDTAKAVVALLCRQFCTTPHVFREDLARRARASEADEVLAPLTSDLGPAEEASLVDAYLTGVPLGEGELAWLERARELADAWSDAGDRGLTRVHEACRWVTDHLSGSAERKVVVFSQDRRAVEELASELSSRLGPARVVVSHHGLDDAKLAEAAVRFQTDRGCRVFVSDELGGEGRNFQFATAVVHFDLPWQVARLEQRIGRLDRIGRDSNAAVLSVVLLGPSREERALLDLHQNAFEVFSQSVGGLEYALPRMQSAVVEAAAEGHERLEQLFTELTERIAAERQSVDRALQTALDSTLPELEGARELAEVLEECDDGDEDAAAILGWARQIHVRASQRESTIQIDVNPEILQRPLVGIQSRWTKSGTFSRSIALRSEDLQFLSPGHTLVDAMIADALQAREARTTVFARDMGTKALRRFFAHVVFRTELDASKWDGDMPLGLATRAHRRLWPTWISKVVELFPTGEFTTTVDPALRQKLLGPFDGTIDRKLEQEAMEVVCRDMGGLWGGLRAAVASLLVSTRDARRPQVEQAVNELREDMQNELAYLRGALRRGGGTEIEQRLRDAEWLEGSVANERVVVDAVAVVVGGPLKAR